MRVPGPEKLIYDENGEVMFEQWAFMLFQLLYSVRCYDAFFICKADLLHTKKMRLFVRSVKMESARFPGPKKSLMRSRLVSCLRITGPAKSFIVYEIESCDSQEKS